MFVASIGTAADHVAVAYDGAIFDDLNGGPRRGSTYAGVLHLQCMRS